MQFEITPQMMAEVMSAWPQALRESFLVQAAEHFGVALSPSAPKSLVCPTCRKAGFCQCTKETK